MKNGHLVRLIYPSKMVIIHSKLLVYQRVINCMRGCKYMLLVDNHVLLVELILAN